MSSLLSSLKGHVPHTAHPPPANPLASLPTPPTIPPPTRLVVALATISATHDDPLPFLALSAVAAWRAAGKEWEAAVLRMLQLDEAGLPSSVAAEQVGAAADAHWRDMPDDERKEVQSNVVNLLVMASIFQPPIKGEQVETVRVNKDDTVPAEHSAAEKIQTPKEDTVPTLSYTPSARRFIYTTLSLLHIPTVPSLPRVEHDLAARLYTTLQQVRAADVESAREKQAEGWGGSTGRWIATGAGAIIGGVAIGLTGGLAAPAIAALVPSFMTFGLLTTATAPMVIGSVFGLAGGGLTSKRVRERWRGVGEFEFVDVKPGTDGTGLEEKPTVEKEASEGPETVPSLVVSFLFPLLPTPSNTPPGNHCRSRPPH